jgi:hypothetical protein
MMDLAQLIGRRVRIIGIDLPNDPNAIHELPSAVVRMIDTADQLILVEFLMPVRVKAETYSLAVVSPRHEGDDLRVLLQGGTMSCAVTCIPPHRYDPARPFDVSWWRGGGAAIGGLVLESTSSPAT